MNIKYGCVTLRAIELDDLELLRQMMNSPQVERNTVGWSTPVSVFSQEKWIKEQSNTMNCMRWIIELDNKAALGTIILHDIDWKNRSAGVGIKINTEEKNRIYGDTKDAYYALLLYAFDELGLNRIDISTLDYNIFSLKLSKSMGFVDEGRKRKCVYKSGKWHDLIIRGLLQEEFVRYDDGKAPWQRKREELMKKRGMRTD